MADTFLNDLTELSLRASHVFTEHGLTPPRFVVDRRAMQHIKAAVEPHMVSISPNIQDRPAVTIAGLRFDEEP